MSPSGGVHGAHAAAPITVKFSAPLSPQTPLPTLSPSVKGSWQVSGDTATFTPATGFLADTTVKITVPDGANGMLPGVRIGRGRSKQTSVTSFTTGSYSTVRLQQLLAQLGYLPLTWTPSDPSTGTIAASDVNAPARRGLRRACRARSPSTPATRSSLTRQWSVGSEQRPRRRGDPVRSRTTSGLTMDGDRRAAGLGAPC